MPRERSPAAPRHSRPDLVDVLAKEMSKKGVSATPEVPTIYEREQPYGSNLHVKVIWDKWVGIPAEERGAIILDAYVQAGLEDDMRRITLAVGLTKKEADRLNIDV